MMSSTKIIEGGGGEYSRQGYCTMFWWMSGARSLFMHIGTVAGSYRVLAPWFIHQENLWREY
jgi:hypothetical protein